MKQKSLFNANEFLNAAEDDTRGIFEFDSTGGQNQKGMQGVPVIHVFDVGLLGSAFILRPRDQIKFAHHVSI